MLISRLRVTAGSGVLAALSLWIGMGAAVCHAQPADLPSVYQAVESASTEIRIDPEAGHHQLEAALVQLQVQPDADTEIRAHLALSEYYLGRDRTAAEAEVSAADQLLVKATRPGLQAGVLTSRAKLLVVSGDSAQASELYVKELSAYLNWAHGFQREVLEQSITVTQEISRFGARQLAFLARIRESVPAYGTVPKGTETVAGMVEAIVQETSTKA